MIDSIFPYSCIDERYTNLTFSSHCLESRDAAPFQQPQPFQPHDFGQNGLIYLAVGRFRVGPPARAIGHQRAPAAAHVSPGARRACRLLIHIQKDGLPLARLEQADLRQGMASANVGDGIVHLHLAAGNSPSMVDDEIAVARAAGPGVGPGQIRAIQQGGEHVVGGQIRFDDGQSSQDALDKFVVLRLQRFVSAPGRVFLIEIQVEVEPALQGESHGLGQGGHIVRGDGDGKMGAHAVGNGPINAPAHMSGAACAVEEDALGIVPIAQAIQRDGEGHFGLADEVEHGGGEGDAVAEEDFLEPDACHLAQLPGALMQGAHEGEVEGGFAPCVFELDRAEAIGPGGAENRVHGFQADFFAHAFLVFAHEAVGAGQVAGVGDVQPGGEDLGTAVGSGSRRSMVRGLEELESGQLAGVFGVERLGLAIGLEEVERGPVEDDDAGIPLGIEQERMVLGQGGAMQPGRLSPGRGRRRGQRGCKRVAVHRAGAVIGGPVLGPDVEDAELLNRRHFHPPRTRENGLPGIAS